MDGQGRTLAAIDRPLDTFHSETYVLTPKGAQRLAIPAKAQRHVPDDELLVLGANGSRSMDRTGSTLQSKAHASAIRDSRVPLAIASNPEQRIAAAAMAWAGSRKLERETGL